jgi:hypothetical protein
MSSKKQFWLSAVVFCIGVGGLVADRIIIKRKANLRREHIEALAQSVGVIATDTEEIIEYLDRKLEAARFWNIVAREI